MDATTGSVPHASSNGRSADAPTETAQGRIRELAVALRSVGISAPYAAVDSTIVISKTSAAQAETGAGAAPPGPGFYVRTAQREAFELLERLFHSREFNLYIDADSAFGKQVRDWLANYAKLALGRGFAETRAATSVGAEIFALEAAADQLVEQLLQRGDSGVICTVCRRGTLSGVLGHAESCPAARLYAAIAGVREASPIVESDESWEASEALLRAADAVKQADGDPEGAR